MRKLFGVAALVLGVVLAGAPSDALAAGSSDTSGDGNHCYLFFEFPDETFAQAMVNDSNPNVVVEKLTEFLDKYVTVGGKLAAAIGNVDKCVVDCQGQCKLDAEQAVEQCIAQGGTPEECEVYGNKVLKSCLNGCVKIAPLCCGKVILVFGPCADGRQATGVTALAQQQAAAR